MVGVEICRRRWYQSSVLACVVVVSGRDRQSSMASRWLKRLPDSVWRWHQSDFLLGSWRQWRWTSLGKSFSSLRSSSTLWTVMVIRLRSSSGDSYSGDDTGVPGI
ncbi:hypothetical protein Bca4012_058665 [Brassica carinata]